MIFRQWKLIALAIERDGEIEGLQTISPRERSIDFRLFLTISGRANLDYMLNLGDTVANRFYESIRHSLAS